MQFSSTDWIEDRCYDHNFLRFLPIFGKKIGVFLRNQCYDQKLAYFSFVLSPKRQFFRRIFRRKYFKNHNIGPGFVSHKCYLHETQILCRAASRSVAQRRAASRKMTRNNPIVVRHRATGISLFA
jgi:hypothetical protein